MDILDVAALCQFGIIAYLAYFLNRFLSEITQNHRLSQNLNNLIRVVENEEIVGESL